MPTATVTSASFRTHPSAASIDGAKETIIVGAGIAGLACALRLHRAGRPFLMISENVGGRIRRSRDGAVNLGAYYVRADYTHVNRYVRLGRRIDRLAIQRHNGDDTYTYWDGRLFFHLPEAIRFIRLLVLFRRRYNTLKRRSIAMGQAAAIRSDPVLRRLYQQPASDFIDQHQISNLARWYVAPGLHGTAFSSLCDVTAFTLLLDSLPVLIPTYEFTPQFDRLVEGFVDAIAEDTVTALHCRGGGYEIETKANGKLTTDRVVIATPTDVATRLLGLPAAERPVAAHMFHIAGTARDAYDRADIHLFAEHDPTLAIARQAGRTFVVSSRQRYPDLDRYFSAWNVLEHRHWNSAFHLVGETLLECEQGPNLYLIGDYNIVGLEDAYLTGHYAADRIITTSGPPAEQRQSHRQLAVKRRSSEPGGCGR